MQNVSEGGGKDKKTKIDQKQGNWENQFLQSRLPWDDGVDDYSKIEDIKGVGWDNFTFDYSEEIGNSFSHDRSKLVLQKILQKVLFNLWRILMLRDDYKSLETIFQSMDLESPAKRIKVPNDQDFDRKSFSKLYMQEFDRSSIEHSSNEKV